MRRSTKFALAISIVALAVLIGSGPHALRAAYSVHSYHAWNEAGHAESFVMLKAPNWIPWPKYIRLSSQESELEQLWPRAESVHYHCAAGGLILPAEDSSRERVRRPLVGETYIVFFR